MISIADLKRGTVYKLNSRNLSFGVWNGKEVFIGIRTKFGARFLDQEMEWTTNENYGTARAEEELGTIPESITLATSLGTECSKCRKRVSFEMERPIKERWFHTEDGTVLCSEGTPMGIGNDALFEELKKYEVPKA